MNSYENLKVGDRVLFEGQDSKYEGEIVCIFQKKSGAVRTIVEDDRGLLLIKGTKCKILEKSKLNNLTDPLIWHKGWYAIYDDDNKNYQDEYHRWWVAPIEYFNEKGYCAGGWEWEKPEQFKNDEEAFEQFIEDYGFEPDAPKGFSYCMESCLEGPKNKTKEEQKQILKDFGFTVDNIPKWGYERSE